MKRFIPILILCVCALAAQAQEKVSFFGSSVCNGIGASDLHGYAWQMDSVWQKRYSKNPKAGFYRSNISVNGDNTLKLLQRYDHDLLGDSARYVVIGLGLGNEGIHGSSHPDSVYRQWRDNMQLLIRKMHDDGKIVVVTNNYPRGDYNGKDYIYVRRMNLEMQEWDVPTVNLLGALDNCMGNGQWADGYQNGKDVYHPSEAGHEEMMHTFVPSLFEALRAGKKQPERQTGEGTQLNAQSKIVFTPEDHVHSYTMALRIKAEAPGQFVKMLLDGATTARFLPQAAADGKWHTLVLSHYQAAGKTFIWLDSRQIAAYDDISLLGTVTLGGIAMQVSDLHFWRSALNSEEVAALRKGKMLRSSLELYCPLNGGSTANLAQSTNTIKLVRK